MGYTLTHIYKDYQENVKDALDSTTFKNICSDLILKL